ncbi:MAG: DUF4175 family protein [Alphaproteobacteria bacterium]|nr:DUF4175 family protein [Alphaproteobacteria bacterium]
MTFSEESEIRMIERRLARLERQAYIVILFESLGRALWRPFAWTAFFCGLWLLGLPAILGAGGEIVSALVFLAGLTIFLASGLPTLRIPGKPDVRRRIECDSGLRHRPLTSLEDSLANRGNDAARQIWQQRGRWLADASSHARGTSLKPLMPHLDPHALRYLSLLVLILGVAVAGPLWKQRLAHGLFPVSLAGNSPDDSPRIVLRITPPEYTGLSEAVISSFGKDSSPLSIPKGSRIRVSVTGGPPTPKFVIGGHSFPMKELASGTYGLETPVLPGDSMVVRQLFMTRARLPYVYVSDLPPTIDEADKLEITPEGSIGVPVRLYDDYGVKDLVLDIELDSVVEDAPLGEPFQDRRLIMSPGGETLETRPVYDLTGHTWVGLPVVMTLVAVDGTGQKSDPLTYRTILPERTFRHPVAAILIEMRKQLAWLPVFNAQQVAIGLEELLRQPQTFDGDPVVYLALRSAASRLSYAQSEDTARAVIALLWETALRLEDGGLSLAMQALRNAQKELEQALTDPDAGQAEIAQKMDALQQALARYMQELAAELNKRGADGQPVLMLPPEAMGQVIDPLSLKAFLDQLRAEALSGDMHTAQEMLSKIRKMMDMLDPSRMAELPPEIQFMNEGHNELQELVQKQQELLDQTRERARPLPSYGEWIVPEPTIRGPIAPGKLPPPPLPAPQPGHHADNQAGRTEQEALRLVLGQLMREAGEILNEIPDGMAAAEFEMRASSAALADNDPISSIPHQERALENLQDAMEDMNQQMAARMQQMIGMSFGGGSNLDPLGRPISPSEGNRNFFGSNVRIPDEQDRERLEEILRILRQRSGDFSRPEMELDYFRRLLRQF